MRAMTEVRSPAGARGRVLAAAIALLAAVLALGSATPAARSAGAGHAGTATLGRTSIGALKMAGGSGYMAVSGPYTLGMAATVSKLTGYVVGGFVPQPLRTVIYAGNGNRPGALVAASRAVTVGRRARPAWVDFPIANAPTLDAGEYWLGYWFSGSTAQEYAGKAAGAGRYAAASYSSRDDPPASFRTGGSSSVAFSLYATLTPVEPAMQNITITSPARAVPGAPAVATTAISRDECTLADGR